MDKRERQEQWKREHIKKNKKEKVTYIPAMLAIIVVLATLAFCLGTLIATMSKSTNKTEYILSSYNGVVTLDGNELQAYTINDNGIYVSVADLPTVGLRAEITDSNVDINIGEIMIMDDGSRLDGEKAERNKVDLNVNGCILKDNGEIVKQPKPLNEYYTVDNEILLSLGDLVDADVIASNSKDETGNIATEIVLNKTSNLVSGTTPQPRESSGSAVIDVAGGSRNTIVENQPSMSDSDKIVVFLDPGHGKDSGSMDASEKEASGWSQNSSGSWGEWRHWHDGAYGNDCESDDGNVSQPNDCWYPIGNGDRDKEPDINLQNCLAAKRYLESTGKYTVKLSRNSNDENPSITKRIEMAENIGADVYICVHSNAGGGSGSAYIAMSTDSSYYAMNRGASFAQDGNTLGKMINDRIVSDTSIGSYSGGCIDGQPYLILFQKTPILCTYLEIGFFDNSSDLAVLKGDSDEIGQAIANGIEDYYSSRN